MWYPVLLTLTRYICWSPPAICNLSSSIHTISKDKNDIIFTFIIQVPQCPCPFPTQYSVNISNGDKVLWRTQLTSSECMTNECSVYFTPEHHWNVRRYEVTVMATCDTATTTSSLTISGHIGEKDGRITAIIK